MVVALTSHLLYGRKEKDPSFVTVEARKAGKPHVSQSLAYFYALVQFEDFARNLSSPRSLEYHCLFLNAWSTVLRR